MKSSIDLLTEHIWRFLDTYEEFEYKAITYLPPDTILKFSTGKDTGIGRIIPLKVSHDYCLIEVYGDLSLTWKQISNILKKAEEEMTQIFLPIDELVEYESEFLSDIAKESLTSSIENYLSTIRENLYLRLILSHRNDPPPAIEALLKWEEEH